MRYAWAMWIIIPLALSACGDDRPVYFGKQGPTEGMPGYVNGQKTNPNIKLGKPYRVGGKTYVPTYDPNYVEEGMASWYGPGFHGGKTANGERFDKYDFTAAHTTLPLPSVVKVTNLKNNKFVHVRVNDRGPFADDRIIDLSKAAAEQIDMVRTGTARVRVEYMKEASERVVALMNQGRDPATIDIAHEIIPHAATQVARAPSAPPSLWDYVIPSAQAAEPAPVNAATVDRVETQDMPAPSLPKPPPAAIATSPFTPLEQPRGAYIQKPAYYVQLGSFSVKANAEVLRAKFSGPVQVEEAIGPSGAPLYRVRMGPFATAQEAAAAISNAHNSGVNDAQMIKPK